MVFPEISGFQEWARWTDCAHLAIVCIFRANFAMKIKHLNILKDCCWSIVFFVMQVRVSQVDLEGNSEIHMDQTVNTVIDKTNKLQVREGHSVSLTTSGSGLAYQIAVCPQCVDAFTLVLLSYCDANTPNTINTRYKEGLEYSVQSLQLHCNQTVQNNSNQKTAR